MAIVVFGPIGLLLGAYISFFRVDAGTGINIVCTVAIAAVFTFLAVRFGGGFIQLFRNLVRAIFA